MTAHDPLRSGATWMPVSTVRFRSLCCLFCHENSSSATSRVGVAEIVQAAAAVQCVDAGATPEGVVAAGADESVVAVEPDQPVGEGVAGHGVVMVAAVDEFDVVVDGAALGIIAGVDMVLRSMFTPTALAQ